MNKTITINGLYYKITPKYIHEYNINGTHKKCKMTYMQSIALPIEFKTQHVNADILWYICKYAFDVAYNHLPYAAGEDMPF